MNNQIFILSKIDIWDFPFLITLNDCIDLSFNMLYIYQWFWNDGDMLTEAVIQYTYTNVNRHTHINSR